MLRLYALARVPAWSDCSHPAKSSTVGVRLVDANPCVCTASGRVCSRGARRGYQPVPGSIARKPCPVPAGSLLFVRGADEAAHGGAATSGSDVLIQDLEDFTPFELRPAPRARARKLYDLLTTAPSERPAMLCVSWFTAALDAL